MNAAEQVLRGLSPAQLAGYLTGQRWFDARGEAIADVRLLAVAALPGAAEPAVLTCVRVRFVSGAEADYQVPLALCQVPLALCQVPLALCADTRGPDLGDALQLASVRHQLGRGFARGAALPTAEGDAAWTFEPLTELDELELLPSSPGGAEQSNTSIIYGQRAILKIYRRIEAGPHPEVEICRFLSTRTEFRGTPALLGILHLHLPAGEAVAGMLQTFVPRAVDGWTHVLAALKDSSRRCDGPGPLDRELEALGRLTADLHAALASDPSVPDFAPRPTGDADLQRWRHAANTQLDAALARLIARRASLPAEADAAAQALLTRTADLRALLAAPIAAAAAGPQIRHHGDYHLGQVLHTRDGWRIIDFEGEPTRSLDERRTQNHPLRDLAGMLRSFAYAAAVAARDEPLARPALWEQTLRTAFLRGYDPTLAEDPQRAGLLALFETERLFYELSYELGSRPAWAWIPLAGIAARLPPNAP